MWSRRSRTSTFLSSWLATRSATVRPKNPEPTTTRSGRASVTPGDCTVGGPAPQVPAGMVGGVETKPSPSVPCAPAGTGGARQVGPGHLLESGRGRPLRTRTPPGRGGDLLARSRARGFRHLAPRGDEPPGRGGARRQRIDRRRAG